MLSDEKATIDLEAAMNKYRHLVFADLRDVFVFRHRLPISAERGYKHNDRDGDVRPDSSGTLERRWRRYQIRESAARLN
jgi:hypothetical protein